MAKATTENSNARRPAAKPAAAPAQTAVEQIQQAAPEPSAAAETKIPADSGADAIPEGAAAPSGSAEAKASAIDNQAGAAEPAGTDGAPAAASEESREQAGATSADRKAAAEEGKQPEETALPPVAGNDYDGPVLVVIGPKKGRRRAGITFGREPTVLQPDDLRDDTGSEFGSPARLLAVLEDPALRCVVRHQDGTEEPFLPEAIDAMRRAVGAATSGADDQVRALVAELQGNDGEDA